MAHLAGKHAETAGGMMNTGFGMAGMISPAVFGFLIQTTGSYKGLFLMFGAAVALMACVPHRRAARQAAGLPGTGLTALSMTGADLPAIRDGCRTVPDRLRAI